jgi:LuxR family maltose regulon positive regulatory protein
MNNISSARLTVPKPAEGEIARKELIGSIQNSNKKFVYIHAGAGYGKTTLLSQIANSADNTVWLSLAGENDIINFISILCEAIRLQFPDYDFNVTEYIPFIERDNFVTIAANALISSIEMLSDSFIIVLDDLHTIEENQIKKFIACFMRYAPKNIQLCLGSRESPWQELLPLQVRGNILELTQNKLAFTRDEAAKVLGFDNAYIYAITEGWPLAIRSFKVLLENGVSFEDIPSYGSETLYSYLFCECISKLPYEVVNFLKDSASFQELDVQMLDAVLNRNDTKLILENLVTHNIFTIKTRSEYYRYHALFKEGLQKVGDVSRRLLLQHKAAEYYLDKKEYSRAAKYAIILKDKDMLRRIILISYRHFIKIGSFSELRVWFKEYGEPSVMDSEILVAKGVFLSSIGNFTEAKKCLDAAIPLLKKDNNDLYIEAMVHKARVLRNFISFEESNKLLDKLIARIDDPASELSYAIVIEKLYNLCWDSKIPDAYDIAFRMIDACARAGNLKVKAWYERYLSAIHFFAGKMKESVYYYEKSLNIPENELQYLDMHGIGIYAAKAYQMLGDRDHSLSILSDELKKLRSTGKYEEMWSGYLFAAEIHYQNTFIDKMNGENQTFETTMKYFTLADEYAPLYRKTKFQAQWAKMQRLTYSLVFTKGPKEDIINNIFANIDNAEDYLKTIIFARLFGYFSAAGDIQNAVKCAKLCIEVGERTQMMLQATLAYGILAKAAISTSDQQKAAYLTRKYLQLCSANGIYEYFRMRKAYDPILEFAYCNDIEPEITKQFMNFAGYKTKKAYIKTLGGITVFPYKNREKPLKMRTKKERELLAFLLDAGSDGVTKEQIYNAIWWESDSENFKNLIGVNLAQIKKDFACLGIENLIINHEKHYSICRDEIQCDFEQFEDAADKFYKFNNCMDALKLLSLYTGEYLSDFEALWATARRIKYQRIYEEAMKYCNKTESNIGK